MVLHSTASLSLCEVSNGGALISLGTVLHYKIMQVSLTPRWFHANGNPQAAHHQVHSAVDNASIATVSTVGRDSPSRSTYILTHYLVNENLLEGFKLRRYSFPLLPTEVTGPLLLLSTWAETTDFSSKSLRKWFIFLQYGFHLLQGWCWYHFYLLRLSVANLSHKYLKGFVKLWPVPWQKKSIFVFLTHNKNLWKTSHTIISIEALQLNPDSLNNYIVRCSL